MSSPEWLAPVAAALETVAEPVRVFVRDDDGGWRDDRLMAMLDVFAAREVPIDVAVIPLACGSSLARRLTARARGMRLGLHQHGYAHSNHEHEGRRCEFGSSRTRAQIEADVARGRARLGERLGELAEPVFTPPWNRCVPEIAPVLLECGLRVLSRDTSAGAIGHPGLVEVPVGIDWFGGRRGLRWSPKELGHRVAAAVGAAERTVGLMLHHAVTDAAELSAIDALIKLLSRHERVRTTSIMELAAGPDPSLASPPMRSSGAADAASTIRR